MSGINSSWKSEHNNQFGSNVRIEDNVIIGENNFISNNVTIKQNTIIGSNNYISDNVVIGGMCRELSHERRKIVDIGNVKIGDHNFIGENVVIQYPMEESTIIKNRVAIGAQSIVGHDVSLGENVIIAPSGIICGYTRLLEGANIGSGVHIHPRTIIGQYTMIGMGAVIVRHIPPFIKVVGVPAKFLSVNERGLIKNGFSDDLIAEINLVYSKNNNDYINKTKMYFDYFFKEVQKGRNVSLVSYFNCFNQYT